MATKTTPEPAYDLFSHKHRFAAWAAARAVQRGFAGASTKVLEKALSATALPWLKEPSNANLNQAEFDDAHESLCESLRTKVKGMSFGRAAKLLAVYLKTMVVVGGEANGLARFVHPPIDAKLLSSLARNGPPDTPKGLGSHKWTKLDRDGYVKLRDQLRPLVKDNPFWMLEEHWDPAD